MSIIRHILSNIVIFLTMSSTSYIHCQSSASSNQLLHILDSIQPSRSQLCQFKFENCIQDSSYADQLDTDCNIYSRIRDCFRSLLDESQCRTIQLKRQYNQAKKNEYETCGVASSLESISSSMYISSSNICRIDHLLLPFTIAIFLSLVWKWNENYLYISGGLMLDWSFFLLFLHITSSTHEYILSIFWRTCVPIFDDILIRKISSAVSIHGRTHTYSTIDHDRTRAILLNDICLAVWAR